jgi:hypothetical protein
MPNKLHHEEVQRIILFTPPLSPADLGEIESVLRKEEAFCSFPPELDPYSLSELVKQGAVHGTEIKVLLDRNVLKDILSIVGKEEGPLAERARFGAALMSFLQASNAVIEPNLALYENPASAGEELRLFRRADNVDIHVYADIALGRVREFPKNALPSLTSEPPDVDYSIKPRGWTVLYVMCLKLASLDLAPMSRVEKAEIFFSWLISDFMLTPAAVVLAAAFFTPRREKPMLKDLRKSDRNQVLRNLQNAAWDLVLIRDWSRHVTDQCDSTTLWLLASRDKALKKVARVIHSGNFEDSTGPAATLAFFTSQWGKKEGTALAAMANRMSEKRNASDRKIKNKSPEYIDEIKQVLEAELLAWAPPV